MVEELQRLLTQYPKVNSLIPLLAACRIKKSKGVSNLVVLDEDNVTNITYNFSDSNLSETDIRNSVKFAIKSGVLNELVKITSHTDYYFGIEVGMDTNARKNRSGDAMELLVEDYVEQITKKHAGRYLKHATFGDAAKEFGVEVPPHQANKVGDFMVMINGRPTNVEVNYFGDGGSKQEIMNSYIPRAEDIKKSGWGFVLVTDGIGWTKNRTQLKEGFERIQTILNVKMCHDGALEDILIKNI
jgi:type II restriction enzyme